MEKWDSNATRLGYRVREANENLLAKVEVEDRARTHRLRGR